MEWQSTGECVPVPISICRGGTSRAVFFRKQDLTCAETALDAVLKNILGSPDPRQIDGVGGATSLTSKVAIIAASPHPDADVDFTFAQVGVADDVVDWGGTCGNISSAVGPYAVNAGFVEAVEPVTVVRIHNTNTDKMLIAEVPVRQGRPTAQGGFTIPGVPGGAAELKLTFIEPAGAISGALLPSGKPVDTFRLDGGDHIQCSIVDAVNPVVFVRAADLGLRGTESPSQIDAQSAVLGVLEEIRSRAAEILGLVDDWRLATAKTPGLPKVAMVAAPGEYVAVSGQVVGAGDADVIARIMSMGRAHAAYAVSGAIATAAAAAIESSVVNQVRGPVGSTDSIRIGHPAGVMTIGYRLEHGPEPGQIHLRSATASRTARHILDGVVWVPRAIWEEGGDE